MIPFALGDSFVLVSAEDYDLLHRDRNEFGCVYLCRHEGVHEGVHFVRLDPSNVLMKSSDWKSS